MLLFVIVVVAIVVVVETVDETRPERSLRRSSHAKRPPS